MTDHSKIVPGQRWVSETEPELGLGIMLKVEFKRVEVLFPAAAERRQYAIESAPIRRVALKPGENLETHGGEVMRVDEVLEIDHLLVYLCAGQEVEEARLSDHMSFSRPEDRLLSGRVDDLVTYDLRVEALRRQCAIQQSPVRGFVGGRVDLIPHQMSIAGEVSSRLRPRVLLADEVGLGKTIEACLIMQRLHLTGRAERILILVPEPLLHQWFVELLRRFNLLFSLFDEERCRAIEAGGEENPFLDSQLVLSDVGFLSGNERRRNQVISAGWDLLIVDEAHHLQWSPQKASPQYALVESLARKTEGLMLLTATPRQLGAEGHFARLRLLDPDRYTDLDSFQSDAEHYEHLADALGRLLEREPLSKEDRELFVSRSERMHDHCLALDSGDESARGVLIRELLDTFGTGRVMLRNTRSALSGFPERRAHLIPLSVPSGEEAGDGSVEVKVQWLLSLIQSQEGKKILLICRTRELSEQISSCLQERINIPCAHFHEGMSLLQRDRSAAYFAEDDGARILICSEIGSEGRNFQFAHHLVLFDLPDDPELLEQRIGRLDRIGQTETIHIHVPYLEGSHGEVLARWYHEGLNAFEQSMHGATEIMRELGGPPPERGMHEPSLHAFIEVSRQCRQRVAERLHRGYDRLLEMNSSRPEKAESMIESIKTMDADQSSEAFLIRLWDYFGLHIEELVDRSYLLLPGHLITDAFPALPDEGLNVTFDRNRALSREDTSFMSWDHPMVRTAMDLLLTSEAGNAAFAVWEGAPAKGILLEVHAVVECLAPASLHSDRFLPVTPLRVQVDHTGADRSADTPLRAGVLRSGNMHQLLSQEAFRRKILPMMLYSCHRLVQGQMESVVEQARSLADRVLGEELDRLIALKEINDHVGQEEIVAMQNQQDALRQVISKARLRMDAVRVVWCQP
ncbi:DEAD/DEAH box helicase family protein [Verrucomicrobiaceae bacterium N1E253]|uniref:DEAD/DEAH box helicase family protein n=1 Tax=Oceaniferula marina TaxID=2748318 RepID=A0A851GGB1_9BACT|nr:helicase-related protein [Oceaniferula marina]NWK56553.1 DEAD/DEAH box helicase family protein [Oceaniferula marina]